MELATNQPKANPKLFKGEVPSELSGETYYAYLDSIEKAYGQTFLRFDCIIKNIADNTTINDESILNLPSIVIELSGSSEEINKKFNTTGWFSLYNLESKWIVITTSLKKTELTLGQFYNFTQVGNPEISNSYDFDSVTLFPDLDSASQSKINEIIKATTLIESPEEDVRKFLHDLNLEDFSHVNVYDVGQGNCNALVNSQNLPLLYYDVGGGFGANKFTYPVGFKLCTSQLQPVILSHWDLDHGILKEKQKKEVSQ